MKYVLSVACLFCSYLSNAQFEKWQPYQFPDKIPAQYLFNLDSVYNSISTIEDQKKSDVEKYAEEIAYNSFNDFIDGTLYIGWTEAEQYVNDVFRKIYPETTNASSPIKIYLARDPSFNAFSLENGRIYLNVGALRDLDDEAGLAMLLGHELGHYLNNDSQNKYFQYMKMQRDKKNLIVGGNKWLLNYYLYSKEQETKADQCGFQHVYNAGYAINSSYQVFEIMQNIFKQAFYKGAVPEELRSNVSSHPITKVRIQKLNDFIASNTTKTGERFIVSEEKFKKFKTIALYESLHLLLTSNNLDGAIETSFKYYLTNSEDKTVSYYLLESVRRLIYLKPNTKQKTFLSRNFQFKKGENIFTNLHLLFPDSNTRAFAQNKTEIFRLKPFSTYEEAFHFFAQKIEQNNITEGLLSLALFYKEDTEKKKLFLDKYIQKNGLQTPFAIALRDDSLYTNKTGKHVLAIGRIQLIERNFFGTYSQLKVSTISRPRIITYTNELNQNLLPDYQFIDIAKNAPDHLQYNITLYEIMEKAWSLKNASTSIKLFELAPEYWTFFTSNELESVKLINCFKYHDKTQTIRNAGMYIFLPVVFVGKILSKSFVGSYRDAYLIDYFSVTPYHPEYNFQVEQKKVNYKLRKSYFQNSVYHLVKSEKHYRSDE